MICNIAGGKVIRQPQDLRILVLLSQDRQAQQAETMMETMTRLPTTQTTVFR
jgi:hypothetical protein